MPTPIARPAGWASSPSTSAGCRTICLPSILSCEYAIGVRNGCFCAHPYVLRLLQIPESVAWSWRQQVIAGVRAHLPGLVRISFGCYNSVAEVDWLVQAVRNIACGEIAGNYEQDPASGRLRERSFHPDLGSFFQA